MDYALIADFIVALHAAFILFVIFGQVGIFIGGVLRHRWVRNFYFRFLHLAAIGVVVLEAAFGIECPLTTWEHDLRRAAGEKVADASFIGQWLHDVIFVDSTVPETTLRAIYCGFGGLVLLCFIVWPPRRPVWLGGKKCPEKELIND
jgi:hypothetical protein